MRNTEILKNVRPVRIRTAKTPIPIPTTPVKGISASVKEKNDECEPTIGAILINPLTKNATAPHIRAKRIRKPLNRESIVQYPFYKMVPNHMTKKGTTIKLIINKKLLMKGDPHEI
jgi:hypothetical protein